MTESKEVAYCGLYCGDCVIKDQKIGESSQHLMSVLDSPEFVKLANGLPSINSEVWNDLKRIDEIKPVLKVLCNLDCEYPCKNSGGTTSCEIRICCQKKNLEGCWECSEMEKCEVLAAIFPVHRGSNLRNMKIIREKGMNAFLCGKKYW